LPAKVKIDKGIIAFHGIPDGDKEYLLETIVDERPHVVESGSPHASYAIIEKDHDAWDIEFIHVKHEWEKAAEKAGTEKRFDWESALHSGYVS